MRLALRPTTWAGHVDKWGACTRCPLHEVRSQVVLARGALPCDILFVGEGPGRSEDAALTKEGLGLPFVGPVGKLQDEMIEEALDQLPGYPFRLAFTNLLACLPLDRETGEVLHPSDFPDSVDACAPRLVEFVQLARPRLLVRVGKDATDWLAPGFRHSIKLGWDCPSVDLVHPGSIIRKPVAQQSHERRRWVIILREAVEKHLCHS